MAEHSDVPAGGADRPVAAVDLHDTELRAACDRAARLAAALLGTPAALVSFAREDGEVVAAAVGLPESWAPLHRLPPGAGFATAKGASAAPRAASDAVSPPLVAAGIGAHLAVPLATRGGEPVGALVALDRAPRPWTAADAARLGDLAALLVADLDRRAIEREARQRTGALVRTTEALLDQIAQREHVDATLRESEAGWRTLIEHAPEAILSHEGGVDRIVEANGNAVRLFGMPRERLLGMGMVELSAPIQPGGVPAAARVREVEQRALAGEAPVLEWLVRTATGRLVPCEVRLVRLPGTRTRLRSSITDISERKRAEEALRASEAALAEAQRIAGMGSWELDLDSGRVRYSSGLYHLLGVPADTDAPLGEILGAHVHPDDRAAVEEVTAHAVRHAAPYALDHRGIGRDGAELCVHHQGDVVRDADGRPVRYVATIVDVTERTRAERERAELLAREQAARRDAEAARERLTLLVDASVRLAASLEIEATLETVSRLAVPQRARWSAVWVLEGDGGARRVDAGDVPRPGDPVRAEVESLVGQVLHSGAVRLRQQPHGPLLIVPLRVRDRVIGALAWVAGAGAPGYADDDLALAADLARRGALALEAARLYEEAQSTNRLKDEFLATLSHELRTPLAAVLGWASLIRSDGLGPEEVNEALEAIERNARAQSRLVDDVLEVSRIVTGKIRLTRRPIELAPTIRSAVEALRPSAQEKRIQLTVDVPEAPAVVLGDADRLQQVWSNLLSNAIKFTPPGGTVSVALRTAGPLFEVAVHDTGEGIAPEVLPHVFERFRQGDSSNTRRHGGLGLGLALVRHFVELLGGAVEAHSEGPGRGADLLVRLPPLDPQAALALLPAERTREHARRPLSGLRVLLVEDDADVRAMMRAVLSRRGAAVSEAGSVAEALAAVDREPPDVVLSDLQMPGEDGYALLRRLRERERAGARRIPTAAVTAHAGDEHRARALAAGFQAQLVKPVDAETLAGLVATLARGGAALER